MKSLTPRPDGQLRRHRASRTALLLLASVATSALSGCSHGEADAAALTGGGSPQRGATLIRSYGCGTCHTAPRVPGANATVGPNLQGIASRAYIAGVLPNTPNNMVTWIQNPQGVDEKTAMPNLGVSSRDARDIAAYLYTLK
jgi:cytochrome c2